MLQPIAKFRPLAIGLLCILILAASLDKLPDPPALQPGRGDARAFCLDHHGEGSVDKDCACPRCCALILLSLVQGFGFEQVFETDPPGHYVILMRQASDSSPPSLAS
jgi:hypothetical protein